MKKVILLEFMISIIVLVGYAVVLNLTGKVEDATVLILIILSLTILIFTMLASRIIPSISMSGSLAVAEELKTLLTIATLTTLAIISVALIALLIIVEISTFGAGIGIGLAVIFAHSAAKKSEGELNF